MDSWRVHKMVRKKLAFLPHQSTLYCLYLRLEIQIHKLEYGLQSWGQIWPRGKWKISSSLHEQFFQLRVLLKLAIQNCHFIEIEGKSAEFQNFFFALPIKRTNKMVLNINECRIKTKWALKIVFKRLQNFFSIFSPLQSWVWKGETSITFSKYF